MKKIIFFLFLILPIVAESQVTKENMRYFSVLKVKEYRNDLLIMSEQISEITTDEYVAIESLLEMTNTIESYIEHIKDLTMIYYWIQDIEAVDEKNQSNLFTAKYHAYLAIKYFLIKIQSSIEHISQRMVFLNNQAIITTTNDFKKELRSLMEKIVLITESMKNYEGWE